MPHFICRWPCGDVLLACVDNRQELDQILQERSEPGVCKVARYHGPLVLEMRPKVPGLARTSATRFKPAAAAPAFEPIYSSRASTGDVDLVAADGSMERVHRLVLSCRLPALLGRDVAASVRQVCIQCIPDAATLAALVGFLYLDDASDAEATPALHTAAVQCGMTRLVKLCEHHFAQRLELQLAMFPGMSVDSQLGVVDSFLGWARYAAALGRQELLELAGHALTQHVEVAATRPGWCHLSAEVQQLIRMVASSTDPPLIQRTIASSVCACVPLCGAASAAATAAGETVITLEAEAFAQAGGTLTTHEWAAMTNYRSNVAQSLLNPVASPLVLTQTEVQSAPWAGGDMSTLGFELKTPQLQSHKRLMDSVCRFAYPSTHTLVTEQQKVTVEEGADVVSNRHLTAALAGQPVRNSSSGAASGAGAAAGGSGRSGDAAASTTPAATTAAVAPTPATVAPLAAPDIDRMQRHAAEAAARALVAPAPAAAAAQQQVSSEAGGVSAAAAPRQPAASTEHQQQRQQQQQQQPARLMQSPLIAAELSLAVAAGGAGRLNNALGSGSSIVPDVYMRGPDAPDGLEQQQQADGSSSRRGSTWASSETGQASRGSSGDASAIAGLCAAAAAAASDWRRPPAQPTPTSTSSRRGLSRLGARPSNSGADEALTHQQPQQQPWSAAQQQQPEEQQVRQHRRRSSGAPLVNASPIGLTSPPGASLTPWGSVAGSETLLAFEDTAAVSPVGDSGDVSGDTQASQPVVAGMVDTLRRLPLHWQQQGQESSETGVWGSAEASRRATDASGPNPGSQEAAAPTTVLIINGDQVVHAGASHSSHPAAAAQPSALNLQPASSATAGLGVAGAAQAAAAAAASSGQPSSRALTPTFLSRLQRALVEDFILYDESSAARQHVVSWLVAVERGDAAQAEQTLSSACTDLIAATAPSRGATAMAVATASHALVNGGVPKQLQAPAAARRYSSLPSPCDMQTLQVAEGVRIQVPIIKYPSGTIMDTPEGCLGLAGAAQEPPAPPPMPCPLIFVPLPQTAELPAAAQWQPLPVTSVRRPLIPGIHHQGLFPPAITLTRLTAVVAHDLQQLAARQVGRAATPAADTVGAAASSAAAGAGSLPAAAAAVSGTQSSLAVTLPQVVGERSPSPRRGTPRQQPGLWERLQGVRGWVGGSAARSASPGPSMAQHMQRARAGLGQLAVPAEGGMASPAAAAWATPTPLLGSGGILPTGSLAAAAAAVAGPQVPETPGHHLLLLQQLVQPTAAGTGAGPIPPPPAPVPAPPAASAAGQLPAGPAAPARGAQWPGPAAGAVNFDHILASVNAWAQNQQPDAAAEAAAARPVDPAAAAAAEDMEVEGDGLEPAEGAEGSEDGAAQALLVMGSHMLPPCRITGEGLMELCAAIADEMKPSPDAAVPSASEARSSAADASRGMPASQVSATLAAAAPQAAPAANVAAPTPAAVASQPPQPASNSQQPQARQQCVQQGPGAAATPALSSGPGPAIAPEILQGLLYQLRAPQQSVDAAGSAQQEQLLQQWLGAAAAASTAANQDHGHSPTLVGQQPAQLSSDSRSGAAAATRAGNGAAPTQQPMPAAAAPAADESRSVAAQGASARPPQRPPSRAPQQHAPSSGRSSPTRRQRTGAASSAAAPTAAPTAAAAPASPAARGPGGRPASPRVAAGSNHTMTAASAAATAAAAAATAAAAAATAVAAAAARSGRRRRPAEEAAEGEAARSGKRTRS